VNPDSGAKVIRRLLSGGQTGVDRAALDVALALGLPCGGWCPRGRRAEDGRIPPRYPVAETESAAYPVRTRSNVRDADATLVLTRGAPRGGTALTVDIAAQLGKPCLVVDLLAPPGPAEVRAWLAGHGVETLNVAGPRESENPGIHEDAVRFMRAILSPLP
jgi:hypothetical protein